MILIGLSHRTAPVEVREKLAAGSDALPSVLARLSSRSELAESMFLSTCNRIEVVAVASQAGVDAARRAIREELARQGGARSADEMAPYLYEKLDDEAVRHLFRVAASLDSMVLGEPQILGQVKEAYDSARAAGTLHGSLGRCVSKAFSVAKRVRTETEIGIGSVSISSVAVDLARRVFGDLADRTVLLLGAGEMAEAAAQSLGKSARALRICNRNFDRAAALAGTLRASAVPWEGLAEELVAADVVVASTASSTHVVTRAMAERAMRTRKGKTLLFVDIAVPRNVDPSIHGLANAYVFNVDDLEQEVARGMAARHAHVDDAERIVSLEVADFLAWRRGLEVQPTLVGLRTKARAVFLSELERSLAGRLKHLTDSDRAALNQMVESSLNKLFHAPTVRLKAKAAEGDDAQELAAAVRYLFDLEEIPAPKSSPRMENADEAPDDERLPH
jgi:glutamyl-tRNA reductase